MRRPLVSRLAAGAATALLAVAVSASPATAADEVNIDYLQNEGGEASAVVAVDGLPPTTPLSADTVGVKVDGEPVDATVKVVSAGDVERASVLVLDASNSMRKNDKYQTAVAAVQAYLDAVPDDVAVGFVTFSGEDIATLDPTTDRAALLAALDQVELGPGTPVFDALEQGIALTGTEGVRSVLLLSDGGDTGSSATLEQVTGEALDQGVVVDVVGLGAPANAERLAPIADGTGGTVVPADPAELASVFADQADALAQQLLLSFDLPEGATEEADVEVSVTNGAETFTDAALMSVTGIVAPEVDVVESGRALVSTPGMLIGAAALFLGFIGVLFLALGNAGKGASSAERRMESYFSGNPTEVGGKKQRGKRSDVASLRTSAVAAADRVVSKDLESKISLRLMGAGSSLTASEWILLHAGIAFGAGVLGWILSGPLLAFLGLVLGAFVPWIVLGTRHSRRLAKFNGQLADTLGLMAGGLQAGLSLPQAVDTVVQEGQEPMASELRRALVEQRLGIDITDALESVGTRMESDDFAWIVMAIRIQREVGGNLAEILNTVADTLREREYLRRQVRALSAEGRLSGYILTGLPPLVFFYMMFANPEYAEVLYTTTVGFLILGAALMLLAIGGFFMSKLATVEV